MEVHEMKRNAPTLEDVAKHAGVSIATASRAMNSDNAVRNATAVRVREAAAELNYQPNMAGRMLSGGPSNTVCLVVPSLSHQALSRFYYASLIAGAEEAADQNNLHLLVKNKRDIDGFFALLEQQKIGGVLLRVGHNHSLEQRLIRYMRKTGTPFVLIGSIADSKSDATIYIDITGGARELAHHFVEQGFKRILYISGPKRNADSNDRYYGFRLGLTEKGFDERNLFHAPGDYTPESGVLAAQEHLRQKKIDAVFASTDHTALGVLTYCASQGISVPHDVAVAGYDDQDYAAYTWPSLTTVRQPVFELGQHAIEQLIRAMESTKRNRNNMVLTPKLIVRESTSR